MKKNQVSIFLIIGIMIITLVLSIILLNKDNKVGSTYSSVLFTTKIQEYSNFRDLCIEKSVNNALTYNLIKEENKKDIENYIKYYLYYCLLDSPLKNTDYNIQIETPLSKDYIIEVNIYEDSIHVKGELPIKVSYQDNNKEFKKFEYILKKEKIEKIKESQKFNLISTDKYFILQIPENTKIYSKDNFQIDLLSAKFDDKEKISQNPYLEGTKVYYITDSKFSNKVKACINYIEDMLNEDSDEKNLALAWYDEERKVWVARESEINTKNKIICADFDHFSPVALVKNTYTEEKNKEKTLKWDFFIEHIHRPCSSSPDNIPKGKIIEQRPEIDKRYTGLFNKNIGTKEYEEFYETRWKFNDFKEKDERDAPHRYGVYATPQMYQTLLIRGHDNLNTEYIHISGIRALKSELYNEQNIWKFEDLNENQEINIQETKNDRITGSDMSLIKYKYSNINDWIIIPSFEPNEHAELSIEDWDDDDLYSITDNYCDDKPCLKCIDITNDKNAIEVSCDLYKEDCLKKCKSKAKEIYLEFEKKGWAPWNPSNDGILDYKYISKEQLIPNLVECKIEHGTVIGTIIDCNIDETDIATPMFWGYGNKKTGLRSSQGNYKDSPDFGYEGAGNNDHPVTYDFEIISPICDETEAKLKIKCSEKDLCIINLNNHEFRCENKECIMDVKNLLIGSEKGKNKITGYVINKRESQDVCAYVSAELILTECPSKEKIECGDGIINQNWEQCDINPEGIGKECDNGQCIMSGDLKCTCPSIGVYCGDGIINQKFEQCDLKPDGSGVNCQKGICIMTSKQRCICKEEKNYCGDNIIQRPNDDGFIEECDGTDDKSCPGQCKSDCTCPNSINTLCKVCHWDQGQPGCFREYTSNCPNSWNGHNSHQYDILVCDPNNPPIYSNGKKVDPSECKPESLCNPKCYGTGLCNKNNICDYKESCDNCPQDCGKCPSPTPQPNECKKNEIKCGNYCCSSNEECKNNICIKKDNPPKEENPQPPNPPENPPNPPTNKCKEGEIECGTECCNSYKPICEQKNNKYQCKNK
ncbi:MAG: hypothetical protein QXE31_03280 [Candidatus Woesearchaeota archaeon]